MTNMPLMPDKPISNRCHDCYLYVEKCPDRALTLILFKDHPQTREQVLNIEDCKGDDGCLVCLTACPWLRK